MSSYLHVSEGLCKNIISLFIALCNSSSSNRALICMLYATVYRTLSFISVDAHIVTVIDVVLDVDIPLLISTKQGISIYSISGYVSHLYFFYQMGSVYSS